MSGLSRILYRHGPRPQYRITAREIIRRLPRHLGSSARTRLLHLFLLLSDLPFPPYHSCPTCALSVLALFHAPDSMPSSHSNFKPHLVHRLSFRSRENRVPSSSPSSQSLSPFTTSFGLSPPVQSLIFLLHTLIPSPAYRATRIRPERTVLVKGCSCRCPLPAILRASKQQQLDVASINAVGSETGRDKSWIAPSLGMPCQARRVTPQS
jgi:hypothetical protein